MIFHPDDPGLRLLEPADLDRLPTGAVIDRHRPALRAIVDWAGSYLCAPHPDLGRRGAVCPYAQGSLTRGRFYLAVRPGRPRSAEQIVRSMQPYREWFTDLAPRTHDGALFTTILVLFPDLPPESRGLIDEAQRRLKDGYTRSGLMIGEFHDGPPDKGGLRNPAFRPLRSPVPLLAIRHMIASDEPFLSGDPRHHAAYLERFGGGAA
ncbi:DUF6875 domain-containing protein [Planobispora siamensis]|uniref:DUF6875 domain-containing protein n=1 Tax=Planobispora siamensis TaxID=936338 RepID=A0A8J3WQ54_9ACTN|nr:hypothetical protein [Planobispora siamensis]GIH97685.1 hypothetical protein Psi01_83150 [Planobispora siamensis]